MQTDPTILSLAVNAVTAALAWVTGEAGRIAIAGGAGGLSRWFTAEKRKLRDGVISIGGGLLSGTYLWPLVLQIIGVPFGGMEETPNNIAMAAFVSGALGMSFVKILTAMVEARVGNATKGKGDE